VWTANPRIRAGGLCHALGLNRLLDELLDVLVE
jgi:hypothetical protein